jgi:hypothetical protein
MIFKILRDQECSERVKWKKNQRGISQESSGPQRELEEERKSITPGNDS